MLSRFFITIGSQIITFMYFLGGMSNLALHTAYLIFVPPFKKDRIFERHYRSKEAIKTDPTGSGVGLVLVKDFVDHYKGQIEVRSTEIKFGKYLNVFSLYLPGR
mgnify:CR=1 FL=1